MHSLVPCRAATELGNGVWKHLEGKNGLDKRVLAWPAVFVLKNEGRGIQAGLCRERQPLPGSWHELLQHLSACALLQAPGLLPPAGSLFPQSAADIAQIQELQTQVEDAKKEKQSLQEKVIPPQLSCAELSSEIPAPSEPQGTRQWDAIPMSTVRPSLHRGVTKQFLLHKTGWFLFSC